MTNAAFCDRMHLLESNERLTEKNCASRIAENGSMPMFMNAEEWQPLLSVVVPVYETEGFLNKCLGSITGQTYKNLEIIVVSDGASEGENEIVREYAKKDSRVKLIRHEENKGLLQARITGMEAAKGEYFAFVDSDDYVSVDWFRTLAKKAVETESDMVVGEWCFEHENNRKEFLNLEHFRYMDIDLRGSGGFDEFMRQAGTDFSWHTIWNKIYRKSVWDRCADGFRQFSRSHGHMVMCEDLVFSCALWHGAKKVTNIHNANYIYQLHDSQATKISGKGEKAILKTIGDAAAAFGFFEKLLTDNGIYGKYGECFERWRDLQAATLWKDLKDSPNIKKYERRICEKLKHGGSFSAKKTKNDFIYQISTTVEDCYNWLEHIKIMINSDETDYVSFDIFDTAIVRPFIEPADLLSLLNKRFGEIFDLSSYVDFSQIRIAAEQRRRKAGFCEEITLEEIYGQISEDCMFDEKSLMALMEEEIELEKRFCSAREMGKELYALARDCGKKIVFCSDMYLPKSAVEEILEKNGYGKYEKLYLSSELRLTKSSKNLYRHMIEDLKLEKHASLLHIGDNDQSDVAGAREIRLRAAQMSKTADMFKNSNPGAYSGDHFNCIVNSNLNGNITDLCHSMRGFGGFRSMLALVANKIYDNPYLTYNKNTDFNANPYFIGYYLLGAYSFGILSWLADELAGKGIGTLHFAARDGYLLKKAYDIYSAAHREKKLPKSNYLHISRKSCVLLDMAGKEDFYSIVGKLNIFSHSPKKLAEMFRDVAKPEKYGAIPEMAERLGLGYARNFTDRGGYERFIKILAENIVDFELLREFQKNMSEYFRKMLQEGDALFDIGYSGRAEAALSNLLGFPVDSYYVHSNSEALGARQNRHKFKTKCFYGCKPAVTGVIREHLFMEQGPSAIGYKAKNGVVEPVFEEYREGDYSTRLVTETIQRAALDFVKDFIETFEGYGDFLDFRRNDFAMPLEYYLHYSKPLDRLPFSNLAFEDDFGEGKTLDALEFWNHEMETHSSSLKRSALQDSPQKRRFGYEDFLDGEPKWKKAMFMLLFDRKLFAKKVGKKTKRKRGEPKYHDS